MLKKIRIIMLLLIALLPSFLKRPCYRLFFNYRIGRRTRIGFSLLDVENCSIGDDCRVGHFNLITGVKNLSIGEHARIGHLNILRGGDEISIGRYAEIFRLNEINAIPEADAVNPTEPVFTLGAGSVLTTGHKIDFTDRVEIGRRTVMGGRNSSVWTHNRQRTMPVRIGSCSYIGSEIRVAPGGEIPSHCIVGIGSVITKKFTDGNCLLAGVPAKVIRELNDEDRFLTEYRTRPDLPETV